MESVLKNYTVNQIGFVVKDIEAVASKFVELTGMEVAATSTTAGQNLSSWKYHGESMSGGMRNLAFRFGNIELEFIQPEEGNNVWSEYLHKHGEGIHHIAFNVKDIPSIADALQRSGYSIIQYGEFEGGKFAYFDTEDAIKTAIELLEFD